MGERCALCEGPIGGAFCEACYPEFLPPPPRSPPLPQKVHPLDLTGVRIGILAVLLPLAWFLGVAVGNALLDGKTHVLSPAALSAGLDALAAGGGGVEWEERDTLVVEGWVQLHRSEKPLWLAVGPDSGLDLVILGDAENLPQFRPGARIRLELTFVERYSLRLGRPLLWVAEDLNQDFPGTLLLSPEDLHLREA